MSNVDIAVYSLDDQLKLIVEVKASAGLSEDWARRYRRNLFAHSLLPLSPFFMLVTHDQIFLWSGNEDTAPNHSSNTSAVLLPYFEYSSTSAADATSLSLQIATVSWLSDQIRRSNQNNDEFQVTQILLISGLYKEIRGGYIQTEVDL